MKFVIRTISCPWTRSASVRWHTTRSASPGIVSTALFTHVIVSSPFFIKRALKRVAPKALDPIPASQAKTILRITPEIGFTGFPSPAEGAFSFSPWKSGRDLIIGIESIKVIAVEMSTPRIPTKTLPFGDIRIMEIKLPGEAGATRPKSVRVKKNRAHTLPIMTGRSNIGRAST